jgi:pseudouridine synthase
LLLRLQKILQDAGISSRREAEKLILEARVKINGKIVTKLGEKANPDIDYIKVDGKQITIHKQKKYILLYKPKNYLCTMYDPLDRPIVTELLKKESVRVFPVGRLDFDAEGVLLLTNNGDLSHKLMHPKFNVPKEYLVKVKGFPEKKTIKKLKEGIELSDGTVKPKMVKIEKKLENNSWIKIIVTEGRNHLIKRLFEKVGHPVLKLTRISFANLNLNGITKGKYRQLTLEEVKELKEFVEKPDKRK